jgi:hypothetical protein
MSIVTNNLLNGKGQSPRKYKVNKYEEGYSSIDWSKNKSSQLSKPEHIWGLHCVNKLEENQNIKDLNLILSATNSLDNHGGRGTHGPKTKYEID